MRPRPEGTGNTHDNKECHHGRSTATVPVDPVGAMPLTERRMQSLRFLTLIQALC